MENGTIRKMVFPKWLMHRWPLYPLAFCSIKETVLVMAGILFSVELFFGVMYFISDGRFPVTLPAIGVFATFGSLFLFFVYLYFSKTYVISKDCLNCQFSFHIIAHETIHIQSNTSNELKVERQTLSETRDRLMPLLKKGPKVCSYCVFNEQFYKNELESYEG